MPLTCINRNSGDVLNSLTIPQFAWDELHLQNKKISHLRMRCCDADVVLKTSKLGTRFFAHKQKGECSAKSESFAHLKLKELAATSAQANGWDTFTEHPGGEKNNPWVADVYASKPGKKLALEIQWTTQRDEETLRRQQRYRESEVLGLWIFRQENFVTGRHTPAFRVREDPSDGFMIQANVDLSMQPKDIPAIEFFECLFSDTCRPGIPLGAVLPHSIYIASIKCWRCKDTTNIIYAIGIGSNYGDDRFELSVDDFDEHEDLLEDILRKLPQEIPYGEVKRRYSRTANDTYLSNGCRHCDALFGSFYEHRYVFDAQRIRTYNTQVTRDIRDILFDKYEELEHTWGIFTSLRQVDSPVLQHALPEHRSNELKFI